MLLMTSKGFNKRRDYEARQELDAVQEEQDRRDGTENPERPLEEQSTPDPVESESRQPLITRLWKAIRGG